MTTPESQPRELPAGTVTFLFTDIEGSTELLKKLGDAYAVLLADQRAILRACLTKRNGKEVDTQGDAFFYSFPRATLAVSAAVEAQRAISSHDWPDGAEVRVRMGLHTGEPSTWEEGYVGMDVHRAARIAHVGHGGQVLLSETTSPLVRDELPGGVDLLNLGRHRLKDMRRPERIHQLTIEGLLSEFPPLKSLEALPPEVPVEMGAVKLPAFLEGEEDMPAPLFVGREREMGRLDGYLQEACESRGGVVFVTGGPGRGKTALLEAFSRRASEERPELLVAWGECSAFTGVGDPYLPFRGIMGMLTGDLEPRYAAKRISRQEAERFWEAMPVVAREVVEVGPDLIDVFVSGRRLLSRTRSAVEGGAPWIERLATLSEGERPSQSGLDQSNLFDQVEVVLAEIADRHPLMLVLDDLQWADSASINLLFHLGRRLGGRRILIVGAYRPEEIALGRGDELHPLGPVLAELKRQYGEVWIDLGAVRNEEGRSFVESYLDSEPNLLSDDFRKSLFTHTEGHPLFTVELLRNLQERGDLIQDDQGRWVEGSELDWSILPARVEGVIEERIGRLEEALRESLSIASVEGEDFTAQVVARVQQVGERKLIKRLSGELEKKHRLVRAQDETKVGEHYLSHFRFAHLLFQRFLYNELSAAERRTMHGDVGRVLEELYQDETDAITVQLANHFSEAGEADKAIEYLHEAGEKARLLFAHEEAVRFFELALEFEKERGDDDRAARTLMKLGLTHHAIFDFEHATLAWEEGLSLWGQASMREPIKRLPPAPHAFRIQRSEPRTLDINKAYDENTAGFIRQIFSGLVEASPDNSVVPDIAQSWEVLEGGTKYIFHLRKDVYWSDERPVTSGDFEYAWKRALALDHRIIPKYFFDIKGATAFHEKGNLDLDLVGVRSLDEGTLLIELEQPTSYFLHQLTLPTSFPVPRHMVEKYGETWTEVGRIVTNGPFRLTSWKRGENMVLTRNEDYHGRFTGNLERVEIRFIDNGETGGMEPYISDQLDVIETWQIIDQLEPMWSRFAAEFVAGPLDQTSCFGFDTTKPPFDDSRVRKAIAMSMDKAGRWKDFALGPSDNSLPATGGFVPPGIPGHSPGISLAFDPSEAKKLLEQAGYPDGKGFPEIDVMFVSTCAEENRRIEQNWSSAWKETLGIASRWTFLEWNVFLNRLETDRPMMFSFHWTSDYPDPDNWLRLGIAEGTGWQHDGFEALIERSRRSMDQKERLELLKRADKFLVGEASIIPLSYFGANYLVKPWVRRYFNSWKYIVIDPH